MEKQSRAVAMAGRVGETRISSVV